MATASLLRPTRKADAKQLKDLVAEAGDFRDEAAGSASTATTQAGIATTQAGLSHTARLGAEAARDTSINNSAAAAASAASIADYSARVQAMLKTRGITNIRAIAFKSAEGWEKQGNQSYKTETRPTGRNLGEYANATAAWAANKNGIPTVAGDYYWQTTGTVGLYECTTSNASERRYRSGSAHVPLEAAIVFVNSGGNTDTTTARILIFDLTDPLMPLWLEIPGGPWLRAFLDDSSGAYTIGGLAYSNGVIAIGTARSGGSVSGRSVRLIDLKTDLVMMVAPSTVRVSAKAASAITSVDGSEIFRRLRTFSPSLPVDNDTYRGLIFYRNRLIVAQSANNGGIGIMNLSDFSRIVSGTTNQHIRPVVLSDRLFAINLTASPNSVVDYGRIDSLGASFPAINSWTSATVPALSSSAVTNLGIANNSLIAVSASAVDQLWPNPAVMADSLIARRGTTFATPPMKKPEVMLITDTATGAVTGTITDRSGKGNNATVNGTLTATAEVAGGIAGLSGWSAANYLSNAYLAALQVAAGDIMIPFAFKNAGNTADETLFCRADTTHAGAAVEVVLLAAGNIAIKINGDIIVSSSSITSLYDDGLIHTGLFYRRSGVAYLEIDGHIVVSAANTTDLDNATAITRVGVRADDTLPATTSTIWFVGASATSPSPAEAALMHTHMRNLILGKAALDEIPSALAYDPIRRAVEMVGATKRQTMQDGAITASVDHGQGAAPAVAVGSRSEIAIGGSAGVSISVPERNLREYNARRTTERFTVTYTGNATRTLFPDPANGTEMAVTIGAKPVRVADAGVVQTEGAAESYTVADYGLGRNVVNFAVAPGNGTDVIIEFEREVWK